MVFSFSTMVEDTVVSGYRKTFLSLECCARLADQKLTADPSVYLLQ
jgi:hypothetical protein